LALPKLAQMREREVDALIAERVDRDNGLDGGLHSVVSPIGSMQVGVSFFTLLTTG
jgi:hypothetical protein